MILAILCFWCVPVKVHCHFVGGQDNCFAKPRDNKEHMVLSYGLPAEGIKVSGGGEFSWTVPASAQVSSTMPGIVTRQPAQPPKPMLQHIQVDGKTIKVKR